MVTLSMAGAFCCTIPHSRRRAQAPAPRAAAALVPVRVLFRPLISMVQTSTAGAATSGTTFPVRVYPLPESYQILLVLASYPAKVRTPSALAGSVTVVSGSGRIK